MRTAEDLCVEAPPPRMTHLMTCDACGWARIGRQRQCPGCDRIGTQREATEAEAEAYEEYLRSPP